MVWSVFNYLLTQKLPRKAKVALGSSAVQKVAENAKSCSKVTEHNLFMPIDDNIDVQYQVSGSHTS